VGPAEVGAAGWTGAEERACLERRGEGQGVMGRGGRAWRAGVGGPDTGLPPSRPQTGGVNGRMHRWMDGQMEGRVYEGDSRG